MQAVSECTLELTSHRLVAKEENLILALHRVIRVEKEEVVYQLSVQIDFSLFSFSEVKCFRLQGGFMRSDKITVHVSRLPGGATPKHDYCRLSFRSSIQKL